MNVHLIRADARAIPLADGSVQCVVTSPPYWGLRDYGLTPRVWGGEASCEHEWGEEIELHKGGTHGNGVMLQGGRSVVDAQASTKTVRAGAFCQCGAWRGSLGLEPTPDLFVEHMVAVFREVRRVLKEDGTLWMNLGDSYASGGHGGGGTFMDMRGGDGSEASGAWQHRKDAKGWRSPPPGLKPKDLVGIPWRVAFALQADGWWLRQDIIWAKPNPMPESVTDRCTKAHEYLFLLAKSARYFYDAEAIKEPISEASEARYGYAFGGAKNEALVAANVEGVGRRTSVIGNRQATNGRNRRSVWTVPTQPYAGAHFATFPEKLVRPCVLAGSRIGDVVLDPFAGSGTVPLVASRLQRRGIGIDLSAAYLQLARERTASVQMELIA